MKPCSITAVLAVFFGAVSANLKRNLNYASPSLQHARLGFNTSWIESRLWKRENAAYDPAELNFTHGVASGDPWPESVILWTRIASRQESSKSKAALDGTSPMYNNEREKYISADRMPLCVEWVVSTGKDSNGIVEGAVVASGKAYTTYDIDYTVKVEATGLAPLTRYYYQFAVCGSPVKSPVGRTKTAPRADDDVSKLSFAVFSCSNYPRGYFNAYGNAARKDRHDFVIHLGDYIYEHGESGERKTEPLHTITTLHDYRTRHGQYRTDPDLQILSRDFAWIPTWDDHEFADNAYKDGFGGHYNTGWSYAEDADGISVDTRKANAVRAYFEWMPIRQADMDDGLRVWRSFKMGKLMDLIMLDTRNYDRSVTSHKGDRKYIDRIRNDPARSLMGPRQENWFYSSLSKSMERNATWRVIGNQVVFSRMLNKKGAMNVDDWNGYIANRNRTLQHMYDNNIDNNIILSGDSHQNWVSDLAWLGTKPYDMKTGKGGIGVEFAGTAVSSGGRGGNSNTLKKAGAFSREMIALNDELMWQESYYRGYFYLIVTPEEVEAQFYGSPSVASRNAWDIPLASFTVRAGENHLQRPVAGGKAEAGALKFGKVMHRHLTLDTNTGRWAEFTVNVMFFKKGKKKGRW